MLHEHIYFGRDYRSQASESAREKTDYRVSELKMNSPEMKVFAFVYHFICAACKRVTVGKKLYRAADRRELPDKVGHTPFLCAYCGTWVATDVEPPYGTFFEASEAEIKHSTIEPDPS